MVKYGGCGQFGSDGNIFLFVCLFACLFVSLMKGKLKTVFTVSKCRYCNYEGESLEGMRSGNYLGLRSLVTMGSVNRPRVRA